LENKHLLVFRFSSLGDIAMTVPVLRLLLQQHPGLQVTMVSTEFVRPLFADLPGLQFHPIEPKGKHKGLAGLFRLSRELRKRGPYSGIADLHNVIRSKILRSFLVGAAPSAVIDKGRGKKEELTRKEGKKLHPLKSNFQRYADVFGKLGYSIDLVADEGVRRMSLAPVEQQGYNIGIAPFALHREKTYPPEQMQEVIRILTKAKPIKVFLFGGKADAPELERWAASLDQTFSVAGTMDLQKELELMATLHLMVSMDSANMHLASMVGTPVVSVWGGTHPYLGFYGWGQDPANAVQVDMDCRPSSVFGNRHCENDLACMKGISPVMIVDRVLAELEKSGI